MCSRTRDTGREDRRLEEAIELIRREDPRYGAEAYEFVLLALNRVVGALPERRHITGAELAEGIRDLAIELYGPMARTVLEHWGLRRTIDFGHIVFHLIDHRILSRTESDRIEDFADVFDFDDAFDFHALPEPFDGEEDEEEDR